MSLAFVARESKMIPPSMLKPPNTVMIKDFEHHKLKLFSPERD